MKLTITVVNTGPTQAVMIMPEGRLLAGTYEGTIERIDDGTKKNDASDKPKEDNRG